ncbi:hypothetical protein EIP91_002097 [Steccherinum ochraceum]|uniref:DUF4148 domain-containing protein n=1 Tax=Steccherinum ochraceum TaxID=92696 RepID=A0A4R0RPT0_9APHY|nr:hypothetical protein EIP91_002097 [Steccherinum ochraceum]
MRFAAILGGLLAVAASSTFAVPLHDTQAPGDAEIATVMARDHHLIARDVLQAIHARELAVLDARAPPDTTPLLAKRKWQEPSPYSKYGQAPGRSVSLSPQDVQRAQRMAHRMGTANDAIASRPVVPPGQTGAQRSSGGQGSQGGGGGGGRTSGGR